MLSFEELRDPGNVIDACNAAIDDGKIRAEIPETLYHLTDVDALLSITSDRCLWASLATTLNDALEVLHGVNVAVELLQERLNRKKTEYDFALLTYIRNPTLAPKEVQFRSFPFVVSFCKRVEKSGQWLHYGRSGHGVALGISSSIASIAKYDLIKVDYERESQRERIQRLFQVGSEAIVSDNRDLSDMQQVDIIRQIAHVVALYVRFLAAQMKHPAFTEEDEWRMLAHHISLNGNKLENEGNRSKLKFRKSGDRIVPYEKIDFSDAESNPIKEVILGQASPISEDVVRLLLLENDINAEIKRSEVPVQ